MNIFDVVIGILLLVGFIRGFIKGLFVEIASLVALVGGVYGVIHFSYFIGDRLRESVNWDEKYVSLAAFAGTFVIIVIIVAALGKTLTKIADFASLGILNKILGGVFGMLKIGLILSVVFMFFGKLNSIIPFATEESLEKSVLYKPVRDIAPAIFPLIIKNQDDKKEKVTV